MEHRCGAAVGAEQVRCEIIRHLRTLNKVDCAHFFYYALKPAQKSNFKATILSKIKCTLYYRYVVYTYKYLARN
jgi:hypothetical protein